MADTVKEEIQEYITELTETRHGLCNFQMGLLPDSLLASEASTTVIAIDGLVQKLQQPNLSETVDLDTIVELSDNFKNIQTSAAHLLAKKPTRQH